MNRYDAVTGKTTLEPKDPNGKINRFESAKSPGEYDDDYTENPMMPIKESTAAGGTVMLLSGPGGYRITVPIRHVHARQSGPDLILSLSDSVARNMVEDINEAKKKFNCE